MMTDSSPPCDFDPTGRAIENRHAAEAVAHPIVVEDVDVHSRIRAARAHAAVVVVAPELVNHHHAGAHLLPNDGDYLYGTRGGPDPHQAAVLDAQRSRVLRIQRSPIALHLF